VRPLYYEAVVEGRKLVSLLKDRQFELGRIAAQLEPKYGDETLGRFAVVWDLLVLRVVVYRISV
jgi:hypothetical protein